PPGSHELIPAGGRERRNVARLVRAPQFELQSNRAKISDFRRLSSSLRTAMGNPATTHVPASKTAWSTVTVRPHFPLWLMGALIVLTLALYWPATRFAFVNYDDPQFVTANVHVQRGLNWEGVKWAFGPNEGDYWHPLTWLSLMLDASLFGQKAGGFHFTNVVLHA